MSTEFQLYKHMCEIIDTAFEGYWKLKEYKQFEIKLDDTINNKTNGLYYAENHQIIIKNLDEGETNNIQTLIHELSHHIDYIQNGSLGHQKSFYNIYRKLLYSALDLKKIDIETTKKYCSTRYSDSKKVIKMLEKYVPSEKNKIEKIKNTKTVRIFNSYIKKNKLKENGYFWNQVSKSWDKETENTEKEIDILKEIGIDENNIEISDSNKIRFGKLKDKKEIVVFDGYLIKDDLKEKGYKWDKKKHKWKYSGNEKEILKEKNYLEEINVEYYLAN